MEPAKSAGAPADSAADRETQLRHLTEQCLELMDQVAEARRQREQLQSRCAEMEDLLAGTQRDAQVSRDRLAWLEDVLAAAQRSSAEIQADGFEDLKQHCVVAAETSK